MQHLVAKLKEDGMGVVVHNGSTLFSGDAGSAESNIRRWLLDADSVEAIIQLPTDEFFNTGIYTYLWVLNKNKPPQHKDKIMLINASDKFKALKKSKGSKRKEVDQTNRLDIVTTLTAYQNNDYARVFDKEYFYFNKQAILLTHVDQHGNHLKENIKLKPLRLSNGERELNEFVISDFDNRQYASLADYFEQDLKPFIDALDYKEQPIIISTATENYRYDNQQETLIKTDKSEIATPLGCGKMLIKAAYKKATNKLTERVDISIELTPDTQKDYEIIPFHKDPAINQHAIADFMARYITKPFEYLDNVIGVEINFNKVFYKPETLRPVTDILHDIERLNHELQNLEQELLL